MCYVHVIQYGYFDVIVKRLLKFFSMIATFFTPKIKARRLGVSPSRRLCV